MARKKKKKNVFDDPPIVIADQGFPLEFDVGRFADGTSTFSVHSKNPIQRDIVLGYFVDLDSPPTSVTDHGGAKHTVSATEPWGVTIDTGDATVTVAHFGNNRIWINPSVLQPSLGTKNGRYYLLFPRPLGAVTFGSLEEITAAAAPLAAR